MLGEMLDTSPLATFTMHMHKIDDIHYSWSQVLEIYLKLIFNYLFT